MIELAYVWLVVGALLAGVAILHARDRSIRGAAFWGLVAVPFFAGDRIAEAATSGTHWPAQAMGAAVIAIALLAKTKKSSPSTTASPSTTTSRKRVFLPALAIPAITLAVVLASRRFDFLEPGQETLIALALASVLALVAALVATRARPIHALTEGRRLLDAIGWAAVLPMMLATLGTVFAKVGVGDAIADLAGAVIPTDRPYACLLAYAVGMVVFTAIMGNAFAAFPVMTAGIGLPLLVTRHGADPAALGAIGMVIGYCGTLLTPMAANFNLVPAALLELRD